MICGRLQWQRLPLKTQVPSGQVAKASSIPTCHVLSSQVSGSEGLKPKAFPREQRANVLREVNQVQNPCTPESGYCRSAPKFTKVAARHWNLET